MEEMAGIPEDQIVEETDTHVEDQTVVEMGTHEEGPTVEGTVVRVAAAAMTASAVE